MKIKNEFIIVYAALFRRGEMLKAQKLQDCIPLDLKNDPDIKKIFEECNTHLEKLSQAPMKGRELEGWSEQPIQIFPKFTLALEKLKKLKDINKILDVGCYTGAFVKYCSSLGYKCCGVDIFPELMNKLSQNNPDIRFMFLQAERLFLLKEQFDLICLFDVLEHCFHYEKVLNGIQHISHKGTHVFVNLPRHTPDYIDEAYEHVMMWDDEMIKNVFGKYNKFTFELCKDEHGRDTSFITFQL